MNLRTQPRPAALTRHRRARVAALLALALAALALGCGSDPHEPSVPRGDGRGPPLRTIIQDDAELLHRPQRLDRSLRQIRAMGVDLVRVTAGWSVLTRGPDSERRPDFDAADPAAYEQEKWRNLDRLVRRTRASGLEPMIDLAFWAPDWAVASGAGGERARRRIDPEHFRDFAVATVHRYSGSFRAPGSSRDLPKVSVWTIWNEPNHPGFMLPQWVKRSGGWQPESPHMYRRMVTAAYPAMKREMSDSTVLVGATSSTGAHDEPSGGAGVPPLRFLRELACVDAELQPLDRGVCEEFQPIPGDGWSHHPYTLDRPPGEPVPSDSPDNVGLVELPRLIDLLERLAADGRIDPALAEIWLTEYGYESNPPDPTAPFSPQQQARFLPWAEFLAWGHPQVRSWAQFLLRDLPVRGRGGDWQSGLFFNDGRRKPAARTFAMPLHAEVSGEDTIRVWGHVRSASTSRTVRLEAESGGRFRPVESNWADRLGRTRTEFRTSADGAFLREVHAEPGTRLRLSHRAGGAWIPGPPVEPLPLRD